MEAVRYSIPPQHAVTVIVRITDHNGKVCSLEEISFICHLITRHLQTLHGPNLPGSVGMWIRISDHVIARTATRRILNIRTFNINPESEQVGRPNS